MRRAFYLLLLVSVLAFMFVLVPIDDASARHKPPKARDSTAGLNTEFRNKLPSKFACGWLEKKHSYACKSGKFSFLLREALVRDGNPPPGKNWEGLAYPDSLSCTWHKKNGVEKLAKQYACQYTHKHKTGKKHTHKFTLNKMVSVHYGKAQPDEKLIFYPPHS